MVDCCCVCDSVCVCWCDWVCACVVLCCVLVWFGVDFGVCCVVVSVMLFCVWAGVFDCCLCGCIVCVWCCGCSVVSYRFVVIALMWFMIVCVVCL